MYYNYLDKNYALKYLNQDSVLLKAILENFFNHYKNINLSSLKDDCFFKEVHQLKSFSKNIGSKDLYLLSEEIDKTQKRTKENELKKLIALLQEEIIQFLENEKNKQEENNLVIENEVRKKELFYNILISAKKNRPKRVETNLNELKRFKLKENEKKLLTNINEEIRLYNFKNIVSLITKWEKNE